MAAPAFVTVTKGQAVKIATAVTVGVVRKVKPGSAGGRWLATYVPTGDPAPAEADFRGGQIFLDGPAETISSSEQIDVYVWLTGTKDGEVRVEA